MSRGTRDPAISILAFTYRGITSYAGAFQLSSASHPFKYRSPTTPVTSHWFGLFPLRSPLLRKSSFLSLPPGTKMFQFPGFASITYVFSYGYQNVTSGGFPHSDITGSSLACSSPMLFAAYHVLRRLLVPRHPPYALSSLTFSPLCLMIILKLLLFLLANILNSSLNIFFSIQFSKNFSGGDERNRTADPLLARQVLSQLSYTPMILVGLDGLEPSTSRLSGVRSNHLSYRPYSLFTRPLGTKQ